MSDSHNETSSGSQLSRVALLVVGALCVGGGVLTTVLGGFTLPGGPASQVFSKVGYDGIADIMLTPNGMVAVGMFFGGITMLIWANATAWKETGGY